MLRTPLIERLADRAWRITPQRRAVAESLAGEQVHASADEVFTLARGRFPEISRATVYNTLNELVAMGEVVEVRPPSGPVRYDPNAADHHHHLACTGCGALFDVRPDGVEALRLVQTQLRGFRVDNVDVVFRGRCATCP